MRTNVSIEGAKVFNIKPLGANGCRFAIKINSKKQDGSYTRGVFINCVCPKEILINGEIYNLEGFLGDNEYMDKNTIELIVVNASLANNATSQQPPKQNKYIETNQEARAPKTAMKDDIANPFDNAINKQKDPDWNPFDDEFDDDKPPF